MKFKSVVSLLLCAVLVFSSVHLSVSAEEDRFDAFVVSDLHFKNVTQFDSNPSNGNLPNNELFFHADSKGQLWAESRALIMAMLEDFAESPQPYLLLPGDITENGRLDDHRALAAIFNSFLTQNPNKKIFVINGNHDVRANIDDGTAVVESFKEIYATCGYNDALTIDDNTASYTAELSGSYRLLAIDACIHGEAGARVDAELLEWIKQQLVAAKADGKKVVAMAHHGFLQHILLQKTIAKDFVVDGYDELSTLLADSGVKYIFTGHFHMNDISMATTQKGNTIYDVQTQAFSTFPNTYRTAAFTPDGVQLRCRYVTDIDATYLPQGMTPAQVAFAGSDFAKYSRDYFSAGVQWWIMSYLGDPRKVAGMLDVEEGTTEYELLRGVTDVLGEVLVMPIYEGEDGKIDCIADIAALGNATLPASSFNSVPELAADVMEAFFAADRDLPLSSPEVQLTLNCLKAALGYALVNITNEVVLGDCVDLLSQKTGVALPKVKLPDSALGMSAKVMYMNGLASRLVDSLLTPVIGGVLCDAYAPGDLDVDLEAYGKTPSSVNGGVPITIWSKIQAILDFLLKVLYSFFVV